MINSKMKGKSGELECAERLRQATGLGFRRSQQYSGHEVGDVVSSHLPSWHIEVKRGKRILLNKAMEQALHDKKDCQIPVVCHRRDREEWLVTCRMKDLVEMSVSLYLAMVGES